MERLGNFNEPSFDSGIARLGFKFGVRNFGKEAGLSQANCVGLRIVSLKTLCHLDIQILECLLQTCS